MIMVRIDATKDSIHIVAVRHFLQSMNNNIQDEHYDALLHNYYRHKLLISPHFKGVFKVDNKAWVRSMINLGRQVGQGRSYRANVGEEHSQTCMCLSDIR